NPLRIDDPDFDAGLTQRLGPVTLIAAARLHDGLVHLVLAIVTDVGCGMRWTLGMFSAFSRADESILADGEIVWCWRPDAGVKFGGDDRGIKAGRAGGTRISRKPLRRECPIVSAYLW